jgi:pyruvate formate lyase activating enzyme
MNQSGKKGDGSMDPCVREARLWQPNDTPSGVRCSLCAHRCAIGEGKRGICGVRENRDGVLHTLV